MCARARCGRGGGGSVRGSCGSRCAQVVARASGAETGDHAGDGAERAGRSTVSTPHAPRHAGARTTLDRSPQWLRGTERVCTFCGDYRFVTGTAPIPQIDVSAPR